MLPMVTLARGELAVVLGLLVAASALLVLAPRLRIPYPILLVLGGLALGFVPGSRSSSSRRSSCWSACCRRCSTRPRSSRRCAIFGRTCGRSACSRSGSCCDDGHGRRRRARRSIGMSWAAAFVLGAVVSPTDPIAATAISRRLGVPRRLVVDRRGREPRQRRHRARRSPGRVVAAVTGTFSLWHAGLEFVGVVAGGLAVGLAVGYVVRQARRRIDDPPVEVTISLLTGYFAFIPADLLHVSGVIAVVTAGVYLGWHTPELTTPDTRLLGDSMWEITTFVLNALLFVLLGLQLPRDPRRAPGRAGREAALVGGARQRHRHRRAHPLDLPRHLRAPVSVRRLRERDPYPPWQAPALISWIGHARRRVARRRPRRAAHDRRGRRVPRSRADRLPGVRGRDRDARLAGPVAADRDPAARSRGRRRGREGGDEGARFAPPKPRCRGWRSWRARNGSTTTRPSGSAAPMDSATALRGALRRRRRRRGRAALAELSAAARASCSRPSARRSSSFGATGVSATR